jgi:hypothetical protein
MHLKRLGRDTLFYDQRLLAASTAPSLSMTTRPRLIARSTATWLTPRCRA